MSDHRIFPVIDKLIHLNHAAVGVWPQVTADAVKLFAQENADVGSLHYMRWLKIENSLRSNMAQLINAPAADDIALIKSTSEGLSMVAYGLTWKSGDNVVGIQQEFPSNRYVWESLASKGVGFHKLDMEAHEDPEQALMALCDNRTRLISISAVQYHNGYKMDLEKIGQFCRERNILFCVDGIQQIGALTFDVQKINADFVIADGHKWMLAAEGLGLFYVRREVMEQLSILQYGWHMVENMSDYTLQEFKLAESARRFECGSPNMLGIHALNASLNLLLETGIEKISAKVIDNSNFLMDKLVSINGINIISDQNEARVSGIVTFRSENDSTKNLHRLLSERGVLCSARGGGLRFSPHFYTPREQLEEAIELIRENA